MKSLKYLALFVILFTLSSQQLFAAKGCLYYLSDTKIYIQKDEYDVYIGTTPSWGVTYTLETSCGPNASSDDKYAKINGSIPGVKTCRIKFVQSTEYGYEVDFTTLQCPIDDYFPAVVLAMAGAGFFLIRRRDLAI